MTILKEGSKGALVEFLQRHLNEHHDAMLNVDGDYGERTAQEVSQYQSTQNILSDGVAGPATFKKVFAEVDRVMNTALSDHQTKWTSLSFDVHQSGKESSYPEARVDPLIATSLNHVKIQLDSFGAKLTTSGVLRSLSARVSKNRSSTSLHYLGIAVDLYVQAAMNDPSGDDLYLVVPDPNKPRRWIVYAKTTSNPIELGGYEQELHQPAVVKYTKTSQGWGPEHVELDGAFRVVNLTQLMEDNGFFPVSARRSFFERGAYNKGAAEWWHFQYERNLVEGSSMFGLEMIKRYPKSILKPNGKWHPVMARRHAIWGHDWH